jgi:hypothetical protein
MPELLEIPLSSVYPIFLRRDPNGVSNLEEFCVYPPAQSGVHRRPIILSSYSDALEYTLYIFSHAQPPAPLFIHGRSDFEGFENGTL